MDKNQMRIIIRLIFYRVIKITKSLTNHYAVREKFLYQKFDPRTLEKNYNIINK